MKKKLLIITILGTILSIAIYFYTKSDEITITALGDGLALGMTPYNIEGYSFNDYLSADYKANHQLRNYLSEFASLNKTIKELTYEIKDNKEIIIKNEKYEIQRAINEANILTIAIGMDELANKKITKQVIKDFEANFKELLNTIKILNTKKVVVLSLYKTKNMDELTISRLNAIIRDLTLSNNFIYIDINNILNNDAYYLDKNSFYINYLGHKAIYNEIKKVI